MLSIEDPLRHFMHCADDLFSKPQNSGSELLPALPLQSHSVDDGLLNLSFSHDYPAVPRPLSISLVVDAAPGCGGIAWPAGQILASYLVQKGPDYLRSKTVLELGSGTGLVGLVAGVLSDGNVWITDQAPLLPIMRENVVKNNLSSKVIVAELDWGKAVSSDIPLPDVILAADCVYFEPAFPLLVQTLRNLASSKTETLFCYKKRRKADKRIFSLLKKHFAWTEVTDDPNRHLYNREAITLLSLRKLSN